jgi:hypothetical protein
MTDLTGIRNYTQERVLELGKVLRSKNRKKHLRIWANHIGTDVVKQLPLELQLLFKNPRQEVKRFIVRKTRGNPGRRTKVNFRKSNSPKAASDSSNATK